ncbi:hypothetical protein [Okeania sp. SIO2B9]|uniref:hypothetical protein n=1 Tax=Okeania sp. SIO2B9 TaxID=2607782 RepID=UPI0013BC234E|nr:hypothetical protein [Okeania sp. SIO2B9]NEP04767.1 hypothetical protein [Okeania sp. SIO4D6]NEP96183.1 hypothetical protein [Okeania sp. SIO2F5]NEQ93952.1 hypothetical protein [Okeania sp. SIO2G4]
MAIHPYSKRKKAEAVRPRVGDRRKRSDPATTPARLRNADQERECAPREAEGKIWLCLNFQLYDLSSPFLRLLYYLLI